MELSRRLKLALKSFPKNKTFIVAIDGRSGAGKSTLASYACDYLRQAGFDVSVFRLENLYQGWRGLDSALVSWKAASASLASGEATTWWGWDWAASVPTGPHLLQPPGRVLVVEGVGALTGVAHLRCWVERRDELRKRDALKRDGETYRPFWWVWAEQEDALLAREYPTYAAVDILYRRVP